jgi:dienelactone hydrolase
MSPMPDERRLAAKTRVCPNIPYADEASPSRTCDWYRPPQPNAAAVLFMNSGGLRSDIFRQYSTADGGNARFLASDEIRVGESKGPLPILEQFSFQGLLAAGFSVFDVRHTSVPGPTTEDINEEIRAALDFVSSSAVRFEIDPDRIGLWGCSSGGYLALYAALRRASRARAAAAFYPAGYDWADDAARFPELRAAIPAPDAEGALERISLKRLFGEGGTSSILVVYGIADHQTITTTAEHVEREIRDRSLVGRVVAIPDVGHQFMTASGYDAAAGRRAQAELLAWYSSRLLRS